MLVAQFCPILCNPMDCSPPGSSVCGISQARILEWVAMPSSRGSCQPRGRTRVSCIGSQALYHLNYQGSPTWPPSPAPTSMGWGFHWCESGAQKTLDHSRQVDEFPVAVVTNHQEPSDSKQTLFFYSLDVRSPKSASMVMPQFGHVLPQVPRWCPGFTSSFLWPRCWERDLDLSSDSTSSKLWGLFELPCPRQQNADDHWHTFVLTTK